MQISWSTSAVIYDLELVEMPGDFGAYDFNTPWQLHHHDRSHNHY